MNLRVETVRTIADAVAGFALAKEEITVLSRAQALALIERACDRVHDATSYFGALADRIHSYGRYANAARAKRERDAAAAGDCAATATAPGSVAAEPDSAERKAARKRWANLIRHIYELDPLVCPRCGGMMKIIAFITEPRVLRAILDSLRRTPSTAGSRHPPPPERPPPRKFDSGLCRPCARASARPDASTGSYTLSLCGAINAVLTLAVLTSATFTDSSVAGINVKAIHITELRTALNPARSALSLTALTYSQTPSASTSLIKAADFAELRNGVK